MRTPSWKRWLLKAAHVNRKKRIDLDQIQLFVHSGEFVVGSARRLSATMASSDFPRPCIIGYGSSPSRCGPPYARANSQQTARRGISQFRRNPFARDVLLDPDGMTVPRITALHMLRSTITTVSAPANSSFRGSITHPTQPLCTLRVRRYRRLTQHSLPGDLLLLTWAGLAPAGSHYSRSR